MTHFEFLTVALSFVLGLAVTVLLTSFLNLFRARRTTRMSWLPLTWAIYILVLQFDVWWEVYGLASMESWTVGAFLLLLLLALLLFAAGGLVLPTNTRDYPEDLEKYFQDDGRWAVAVIAAFGVTAVIANVTLFDIDFTQPMNIWNSLAVAMTVTFVCTKRRSIQAGITLAYGAWLGAYMWIYLPRAF